MGNLGVVYQPDPRPGKAMAIYKAHSSDPKDEGILLNSDLSISSTGYSRLCHCRTRVRSTPRTAGGAANCSATCQVYLDQPPACHRGAGSVARGQWAERWEPLFLLGLAYLKTKQPEKAKSGRLREMFRDPRRAPRRSVLILIWKASLRIYYLRPRRGVLRVVRYLYTFSTPTAVPT